MRQQFTFLCVSVMLGAVAVSAQSGRRIDPTPTPEVVREPGFSESKPRIGRIKPPTALVPKETLPPVATTVGDEDTLKVETNLITIPVSVFDRNGLYIPGLKQSDFKIYDNGVEQEIAYFGTTDKPFTVALVLDTSPSTEYKIDEIHRAAAAFVEQLGPRDSVIVIEFYHRVKVHTKATTDRSEIIKGIYKAKFGDGTSLYNAVDEALRKELSTIPGRKAVVLFTDGVDTTSSKNSYDSTLNYAEEADSLIFPIYYNTYLDSSRRGNSGSIYGAPGTSADEYILGRKYLEDLAEVTGGRVFRPEATPGGLTRAFEGIAEELRRQYNVGFVPSSEGKRGERRQIKIRVERPNLIIRARDSYTVGATAPQPAPAK